MRVEVVGIEEGADLLCMFRRVEARSDDLHSGDPAAQASVRPLECHEEAAHQARR